MNDSELIQIGGKSYKQMEVIMLPTKEQRWKVENEHDNRYEFYSFTDSKLYSRKSNVDNWSLSHLYILSSEEIKEGDWVYHPEVSQEYTIVDTRKEADDIYSKGQHPAQGVYRHVSTTNTWYLKEKKIIATTDESISRENPYTNKYLFDTIYLLPRPSDDFIKAYVKAQGKGFDKVLVEYELYSSCNSGNTGRIIEEGFHLDIYKLKTSPDNTITIKPVQEVYVSEKALPFVIEALGFNPLEEDFLGKEAIRYCKEKDYEGSAFYNVAMKAIEFGYQLAQKEDTIKPFEEKTSWNREKLEILKYNKERSELYCKDNSYREQCIQNIFKWIEENLK